MNTRTTPTSEFINDLHSLLGMNGISQRRFFAKYIEFDNAFMLDEDSLTILLDDFDIIVKPKH